MHTDNLDFDIHLYQVLRQRVHLHQPRIHRARKATELGDQADITLMHLLERVRADNTAWDCADRADDCSEGVYHAAIEAVRAGVFGIRLDDLRIGWLQVFPTGRLDLYDGVSVAHRSFAVRLRCMGVHCSY